MANTVQTDRAYPVQILRMDRRPSGTISAIVDVQVGRSLKLFGCKVIQQEGQKAWVAMPSKDWVGVDGKKRYTPVVNQWRSEGVCGAGNPRGLARR